MAEATQQLRIVISAQDQASRVFRDLNQQINSFSSNLLRGAAMGVGFGAFSQVTQGIGQAFSFAEKAVIGFNSSLEQSRLGWTTMLGSAAQADAMLERLQDFAASTPFEFPDVERAARRFAAMGFSAGEIVPLIRSVGEAAAAVGGGADAVNRISLALGQMQTRTKVTAEDMMQLTEVGIPAWRILAEATGQSVAQIQDAVSKGRVSSDVMIEAFKRFADLNWADLLNAKTFAAATSNVVDNANKLISEAFKPLFDSLTELAVKFADFINVTKSADARQFVQTVQNAQTAVGALIQVVSSSIPILTVFAGVLGSIAVILGVNMVAAMAAFALVNAPLIAFMTTAAAVGVVVAANWEDVANAAQRFTVFISEKWAGLVDWFQNTFVPAVGAAASAAWENFANPAIQAFNAVSEGWTTFWNGLGSSDAFQQLNTQASAGWGDWVEFGLNALRTLVAGWNNFVATLAEIRGAGVALPPFFDQIAGKVIDLDKLGAGLHALTTPFRAIPGITLAAQASIREFIAWMPTAVEKAITTVQAAGGTLADLWPQLQAIMAQGANALVPPALDNGKKIGAAIGDGIVQGVKPLLEELANLIARQAAGPASVALADAQAELKRANLVLADMTQAPEDQMAALRRKFELEHFVIPRLEIEGFDANEAVRKTQEALDAAQLGINIGKTTVELAGLTVGGTTAPTPTTGIGTAGAPVTVAPSPAPIGTAGAPVAVTPAAQPRTEQLLDNILQAIVVIAEGRGAPTPIALHVDVTTDGVSTQVYDELVEANSQAQMPPTIQVSAVRRAAATAS